MRKRASCIITIIVIYIIDIIVFLKSVWTLERLACDVRHVGDLVHMEKIQMEENSPASPTNQDSKNP